MIGLVFSVKLPWIEALVTCARFNPDENNELYKKWPCSVKYNSVRLNILNTFQKRKPWNITSDAIRNVCTVLKRDVSNKIHPYLFIKNFSFSLIRLFSFHIP